MDKQGKILIKRALYRLLKNFRWTLNSFSLSLALIVGFVGETEVLFLKYRDPHVCG